MAIYALSAIGTDYIKFGKAKDPVRRLETLQTGCPMRIEIVAVAEWPNLEEGRIHTYLTAIGAHYRGEWFKRCEETEMIIKAMQTPGLAGWRQSIRTRAPKRLVHLMAVPSVAA